MRVDVELQGLNGVLETLRKLPPELVSKRGGVVLRSLKAGARVIRKQAMANLASAIGQVSDEGERYSTGLLLRSGLSISRAKLPSGETGEMVRIRVRRVVYPDRTRRSGRKRGGKLATNDTAWFLEYGTSKQPARPWLRPAFNARAQQAIMTVQTDLVRQIDRVVKKLAQQNAGKK